MSTCTLKLYYVNRTEEQLWPLIPNKLLIVEDIESYLTQCDYYEFKKFQYQKNRLEMSINVDLGQAYSQPIANTALKYASILDDNGKNYYYFIKQITWRSEKSIRLELVMDVLNTFKEGKDYSFKNNTRINREHKNRFTIENKERFLVIKFDDYNVITTYPPQVDTEVSIMFGVDVLFTGTLTEYIGEYSGFILKIPASDTRTDEEILNIFDDWEQDDAFGLVDEDNFIMEFYFDNIPFTGEDIPVINYEGDVYRNIDNTPENINPILCTPNIYGEKIEHPKNALRCDWYLLYRNQNNPSDSLVNPVECYLIPSQEISTAYGYITGGRLIPSFIEEGKYYWFGLPSGTTATLSNGITISGLAYCLVTKANNKLNVSSIINVTSSGYEIDGNYNGLDYITFSPVPVAYAKTNDFKPSNTGDLYYLSLDQSFNNSGTQNKLDDISKLDRTDSKNIKLIKLPYVPYDFVIVGGAIQVDPNWDYVSLGQSLGGNINCLKLKYLDTELKGNLEDVSNNPLGYLKMGKISVLNPSITDLQDFTNWSHESKLYASEFFSPTYYYDSFAFKFELEKCFMFYYKNHLSDLSKVKIDFNMTRTINSKFMFTFDNYELANSESNYDKFLPIARNNEEVLYNVPYINYIRNGYQYDVKNKNISNISNAIGLGMSGASLAVALAVPSTTLKVAGIMASVVSMAMSVKNAVVTAVNNENSIKQKITQAQNQTASVSGSDDVDLMSVYAENRLKYSEYEPRKEFEELLFKLFFYAGYRSDRMGLPNHNTRVSFDYLECDASLTGTSSIPSDCLEELINSFKNGVTYLHKRVDNEHVNPYWDFDQKYENWERIFFE